MYGRIRALLLRTLEIAVMIITAVLVLDVVWQVFTRFIMNNPSSWTEELATILLIWMSLLGASVGFFRYSHLGVDYFVQKLPPRMRTINEIAVYLLVGLFAALVMVWGGMRIVTLTLTFGQRSPALNLRMGYVYLSLPISGVFITLFSVETIVINIRGLISEKHNPETS